MSIARRVLPSRLALKRPAGSGRLAPRANVSFTTFAYASPVHTIPWCDQTGLFHFHSSVIPGSAARISARTRARVSPRQPPNSLIRWSIRRAAGSPVAPGFAARPAFGFPAPSDITRPSWWTAPHVARVRRRSSACSNRGRSRNAAALGSWK